MTADSYVREVFEEHVAFLTLYVGCMYFILIHDNPRSQVANIVNCCVSEVGLVAIAFPAMSPPNLNSIEYIYKISSRRAAPILVEE